MSSALARELVLSYGWNSTSYQILNPGINHWFSPTMRAVVGYIRKGNVFNVAGAPVCHPHFLPAVCAEFEAAADRQRCRVCYVCAEDRLHDLFATSANHAAIVIGAQPVWNPQTWHYIIQRQASLRAQLNRSRNKGVIIETISPDQMVSHRGVRRVLREWIASRRLPPLSFLVEPDVLDGVMQDRVSLVAMRHGNPIAFLVASPVVAKNGYLIELLARSPYAPNGVSELLINAAMRLFASENCSYITLGLVALATAARREMHLNPIWLRAAMNFARAHANRFYNFRGLEQFRLKMLPDRWETIYAISNERSFSPRTLYSMGASFSSISPWLAIGIGLAKAIQRELLVAFR
ncbi:MAG TPA: DUF2156 domain-containing protein [Bryobacteraceae bacterium]|nr:DUF2156 domain-containing protein [Bryobacteraceae bacterium]